MKLLRKILAKIYGVPFKKKEWYNYRAMLPSDELEGRSFIECFDKNNKYIYPPKKGGFVIYNIDGKRYVYEIVGFENENPWKDWLYSTDYINPIIQFKRKL